MNKTDEQKIIEEMLGENLGQELIKKLGIEDEPAEAQAALIDELGATIMGRVTLEVLKMIPQEELATFSAFQGTGDLVGFRTFLMQYIPDIDQFIQRKAQNEFESIRTRAHAIEQGV